MEVLIIGTVWPEPNSSAAGTRMMQLIEFFQFQGARVTFACSASNLEFSADLESIGIQVNPITVNDSSFNLFIKELNPSLVLFDRYMTEEQFGWRVADECPNSIRVLDTEDLHFLRFARHQAIKDGIEFKDQYLNSEYSRREIASIYRCDISLVISKFEFNLLTNYFKIDRDILLYLPFMFDALKADCQKSLPLFSDRNNFVTIGNFLHEPNWDAVRYLKESIWPLIRKELPYVEMHVYGAYTSPKVDQLHNEQQGFLIKGRASSAKDIICNGRILLAPIRFGAGLKGKLVEAMMYGTPSITTTIGAEGMYNADEWGGAVVDLPNEFAKQSIELYKNDNLWYEKQEIGFQKFNSLFNKELHMVSLKSKIRHVHDTIESHRMQNFIGSMLHHHTMNTYKFMSKWIEAKNAKKD